MAGTPCRFCGAPLERAFVDLGRMPLANAYPADRLEAAREPRYPLRVMVCDACLLVQVEHEVAPETIFGGHYAYLSSYSESWVAHARRYTEAMATRLKLGPSSLVVEVASNDGYLLRHFHDHGIPVLGIEPARNAAAIAEAAGVRTEVAFFDEDTARALAGHGIRANLTAANNVLAHVPDIRRFAAGFAHILKPEGVATFEFPHVLRLIEGVQFDTIYHEHYAYLSLHVVEQVFDAVGLRVFDVEELPTHGGSLRVFAGRRDASHEETQSLAALRDKEQTARLDRIEGYVGFAPRVAAVRDRFRAFLAAVRRDGCTVAGYGAAAKGNTFLNFCGAGPDDLLCVVDRNPEKQGRLLPGSHIPVRAPEALNALKPDYVLILPWNLADEVVATMDFIRSWGGRFVVAVPEIQVI
jgi:SAM-dependent methyltransferase